MDVKELTALLVNSSENNRCKFIPWWEDDFENCMYRYDLLKKEEIQNVEDCIAACDIDTLLSPVGRYDFTIFHLLIWLNFYHAAEQLLGNQEFAEKGTNLANKNGITPLLLACCRGNLAIVQLLLDRKSVV